MPETLIEVKVFHVNYLCDICGELMMWDGLELFGSAPLYTHKCKNGHAIMLVSRYPRVVHKRLEGEQRGVSNRDEST